MGTVPIRVKLYDFFEQLCYCIYIRRELTVALRITFEGPPLYINGWIFRMWPLCGMQLKNCVRWTILERRLIGYNHFFFATTLKPLLITNGLCTERNTKSVHGICCLSKREVVPCALHEGVWRSRNLAPLILNLGTRWKAASPPARRISEGRSTD